MYLKSIEIQGFKSFANKTVLLFHEGVTGIVGPNGSGKSNIADAVRWVLGEQKVKSLRGSSMQDVIFAGTQLRKPQGFAFVAITLDNSDRVLPIDYAEVTVSRRLYRSGESEYMINGQAVRLKDVQELFYDTGIGKEGYSIIGQGQIDAILSGRPEERRGLFDEAAGIVKFKRRKQIAEKKLEAERADLVRITDILSELARQVEPLKNQAESAKEYLKLRDELRLYELNLFLRDFEAIAKRLAEIDEKHGIVSGDLSAVTSESEALKSRYEALDSSLLSLEESLSQKRGELQKGQLLINNLENQIEVAKAQIETEKTSAAHFTERLEKIDESDKEKRKTVLSYLYSLSSLSEQLKLVSEKQEFSADGNGFSIGREELSSLREKVDSFSERVRLMLELSEEELAEVLSERGQAASEGKTVSGAAVPAGGDGAEDAADGKDTYTEPEWLSAIKHKQNELSAIKEREARMNAWLSRSLSEQEDISGRLKNLQKKLNDRQQEYHTAASRLDTLRNIAERYEGYGQSIRRVMEARDRVRGIHGVVADLIKTKKEYETAVETALGGSIQNVVTDSEDTAKVLIEHLKKNHYGRATFLPLNAVRAVPKKEYEEAENEQGALGVCSALVDCAPEYKELCTYLLGRTLVVDNMDHAVTIARKYRHTLRIVTLEGELLSPGGSISGGAYKNSSNLIGRQREIDELKERMDRILKEVDKLNREIVDAEAEAEEKEAEIEEFREELKEISLEKNSLSLGIMSDMKLQYSGLSQKTDFLAENIERLSSELSALSAEREQLLQERKESFSGIAEKEASIGALNGHIAHANEMLSALSVSLEAETRKRDALSADRKGFFDTREALSARMVELEKELLRIENQREKEEQRLSAQTDYIFEEYELTPTSAREWYREELGAVSELRARVSGLKSGIKALGPVNVQALEEYKSVSERYEFMRTQHEDLVQSEHSILKIIEELDAGMKRQFNEKFAQIREEFNKVFKLLFGGGQGDIELMREEGEDVLSAGISIIAQPPGKKLQNMMQLSGGEKALTAIALLFAIQNLKPSPFCLLDEIEAALDDSNVTRFAQYLHKLTEHTQFILVTHRRGTMEAADRLYGVTMQEKGVTALVSVDLVSDQLKK